MSVMGLVDIRVGGYACALEAWATGSSEKGLGSQGFGFDEERDCVLCMQRISPTALHLPTGGAQHTRESG